MRNIYKIPVVYRWLFKDKNDTKKIYIGETQELVVNRLYNYRKNDGEVNVRVRDEINNWTNNEKIVVLEILKIVSLVIDKRKNTPKQISNFIERKNSRVLIESLLLENLRSANNVEILNLNI